MGVTASRFDLIEAAFLSQIAFTVQTVAIAAMVLLALVQLWWPLYRTSGLFKSFFLKSERTSLLSGQ